MTATHGRWSNFVLGAFNLTGWLNSISPTETTETAESSVFQQTDKTYVLGREDAKASVSGRFEGQLNAIQQIVDNDIATQASPVATMSFGKGIAAGSFAQFGQVRHSQWQVTSPIDGLVTVAGDVQYSGGSHMGIHLLAEAPLTGTTNGPTETFAFPTGVTAWAAGIHVEANSSTSQVLVKVQTSADGVTWVDLFSAVSFPAGLTGVGSQLVTGTNAPAGQYVRAVVTLADAGPVTVLVAFGLY